jgi:hypothetical protein
MGTAPRHHQPATIDHGRIASVSTSRGEVHEPTERSKSVSGSGNEPASQAERSLRARLAAYALHAQRDPRETTANGRAAFLARFDREVDPEGRLEPDERRRRAEQARRAYFARLSLAAIKEVRAFR